jgi:hypothetical protein
MGFKELAREHQIEFFHRLHPGSLGNTTSSRHQSHWLNADAARRGENFFSDYGVVAIAGKGKEGQPAEWHCDTLRSQHVPFNLFAPLQIENTLARDVLGKLLDLKIDRIMEIKFEWPPHGLNPLGDRTSMDCYVEYVTGARKGFVGFEVKYSEGGSAPNEKARSLFGNKHSVYWKTTKSSGMFADAPEELTSNTLQQIWRNHLLAYYWGEYGDFAEFKSVTLFPKGNEHFRKALEGYGALLNAKGKASTRVLTYEEYFECLGECAKSERQGQWAKYLSERYLIKDA